MLEIVIATNNQNKVKEYKEMFGNYPVHVTSLKDENIISDPEEGGTTFEENALIKARCVKKYTNKIIIADDSGICVHALDEFPGIYSARFMDGHPYTEKNLKIIEMLKDKEDKGAAFHCAIAVVEPNGEEHVFSGIVEGTIVDPVYTDNGFGYDPIFFYEPFGKRFSEVPGEMKNAVSHRGIATVKLMEYIRSKLG